MAKAGQVKSMRGTLWKYQMQESGLAGPTKRWWVWMTKEEFEIRRNDSTMSGVYRVYRNLPDTKGREHVGYAPSLTFALRLCATEFERLKHAVQPSQRTGK